MESIIAKKEVITRFFPSSNPLRLLLGVFVIAIVAGVITGYVMASQKGSGPSIPALTTTPKTAGQDTQTFRDFAEGVIKAKPQPSDPSEYVEGTHTLEREGAVPVTLTSSVVDLSLYEGKKVKVFGETQKALKSGWLMDVGKVEEL